MELEISPQPSPAERAAIVAALEAERDETRPGSSWADSLLPGHEAEDGAAE